MRRHGFTMVELIFVIIIIGILSVAAIPKFGEVKDRAKINGEYSSLSGLDAAIIAKIEFAREDYSEDNAVVLWHSEATGATGVGADGNYSDLTDSKKVLSTIVKKGDNLRIVGYIDGKKDGNITAGDSKTTFDLLMIEGAASHTVSGVKQTETDKDKTIGRPDKNDFWVFNPTPSDFTISGTNVIENNVSAGTIKLIDCNDKPTGVTAEQIDKTTNTKSFTAI